MFGWIKGLDVSSLYAAGQMPQTLMESLANQSADDLLAHGMMVLDHKPAHIIVRRRKDGRDWLRRADGRIAYAIVDYELLVEVDKPPTVLGKK